MSSTISRFAHIHVGHRAKAWSTSSALSPASPYPFTYRFTRYVKGYGGAGRSAREVLHAFARWPTWMWANEEVVALAEYLRDHNAALPDDRKVGFYGLDVYSLWDSMEAVERYLRRVDPEAAKRARRAYGCFDPYGEDVQEYAMATALVPTA